MTFEDGDDAERYGNLLEADGHMEVCPYVDAPSVLLQACVQGLELGNKHGGLAREDALRPKGHSGILHCCLQHKSRQQRTLHEA